MKLTNVKAMVAKIFTVGVLAGAVVMAAPSKAEAQVGVGVRIGPARVFVGDYPRPYYGYYHPGFYGPGYGPGYAPGYGPGFGYGHPFYGHGPVVYGRPWDHRFYHR